MSDLHKILQEEYEKKLTLSPHLLMEMIEEAMSLVDSEVTAIAGDPEDLNEAERFSMHIPIPKLTPNEAWGNPDSQSRKDIDRIFASITRKPSVQARIAHINGFVDPAIAKRKGSGMRFNAILNMMMIIEALQACLNDYSESASGFVFEGFMAAVTGGKQIAGRVGGTLPIEDFVTGDEEPVSLKLLSPKTPIHGSFTNLVDYLFIRGGSGVEQIKYLIGRKNSDDDDDVTQLMLLEFVIGRKNFVAVMETAGNGDLLGDQGPAINKLAQVWPTKKPASPDLLLKMQQVLLQTPGYNQTLGMFKKNLDDQGSFSADKSAPKDPAVKQGHYAGEKTRAESFTARQQGFADAEAGKEPDFESWLAANPQFKEPEKKSARNRAQKKYNAGYAEYRPQQPDEPEQLAESYFGEFHEREKLMMEQERQLMEAKGATGGKQWSISAAATDKIGNVANVVYYGELNLSTKNIKACADIYIGKLKGDMMELLKTTKDFTENIGKYFSSDRRSTAMNANQKAQTEGKEVVKLLAADSGPADTKI